MTLSLMLRRGREARDRLVTRIGADMTGVEDWPPRETDNQQSRDNTNEIQQPVLGQGDAENLRTDPLDRANPSRKKNKRTKPSERAKFPRAESESTKLQNLATECSKKAELDEVAIGEVEHFKLHSDEVCVSGTNSDGEGREFYEATVPMDLEGEKDQSSADLALGLNQDEIIAPLERGAKRTRVDGQGTLDTTGAALSRLSMERCLDMFRPDLTAFHSGTCLADMPDEQLLHQVASSVGLLTQRLYKERVRADANYEHGRSEGLRIGQDSLLQDLDQLTRDLDEARAKLVSQETGIQRLKTNLDQTTENLQQDLSRAQNEKEILRASLSLELSEACLDRDLAASERDVLERECKNLKNAAIEWGIQKITLEEELAKIQSVSNERERIRAALFKELEDAKAAAVADLAEVRNVAAEREIALTKELEKVKAAAASELAEARKEARLEGARDFRAGGVFKDLVAIRAFGYAKAMWNLCIDQTKKLEGYVEGFVPEKVLKMDRDAEFRAFPVDEAEDPYTSEDEFVELRHGSDPADEVLPSVYAGVGESVWPPMPWKN